MTDCESYLDTTLELEKWQGWYLSRDTGQVIRLSESDWRHRCPGTVPVDYRIFSTDTGEPQCSGIQCYPREGTVRDLHSEIRYITDGTRLGFMMCSLEGMMADCFERAYIENDRAELEKANRFIEHHFI